MLPGPYGVGQISDEAKKLMEVTRESFFRGIQFAKPGHRLHEISAAIGDYAESFGYGVVRDLVGHGIGKALHEDPQIPNFRQKSRGIRLVPGMTPGHRAYDQRGKSRCGMAGR